MAEDANKLYQQQAEAQKQESALKQTVCGHCGASLEEDNAFCPDCGEKVGGEERVCMFCQTSTTAEFCPHCGKRVIPHVCPKCAASSVFDFCENCGTILNRELAEFMAQEHTKPTVMSQEEAKQLEASFKQEESKEFTAFQKKLIEHQILLEERDYFNKREKRIIQVFGVRPFSVELPDPEEEAFRMRAYAALEKTVIGRQEAGEKTSEADLERRREDMAKKYGQLLSHVEDEVEAHRIAEEERRRLEQIAFENRVMGTYYYGNPGSDYEYLMLRITSTSSAECTHHCDGHGDSYGRYSMSYDGQNVSLSCISLSSKGCPLLHANMSRFKGAINDSGTIINGYWENENVSHYKC